MEVLIDLTPSIRVPLNAIVQLLDVKVDSLLYPVHSSIIWPYSSPKYIHMYMGGITIIQDRY